jgi:hypothetical protein
MGRTDGPHTRSAAPAAQYRGSRKRIDRLSPFDELPIGFWLVVGVAALMLAVSLAIIYAAGFRPS